MVFSATDDLWNTAGSSLPTATAAVRWLVSKRVPLVLASARPAEDVLALQETLGTCHPFVCGGGAALYIPVAYFPELTRIGATRDGWNIVEFKPPYDTGHAVRLLASLFRLSAGDVAIVGLVDSWRDRELLNVVDVPIVVRSDRPDETQLLAALPSAYLTTATGAAGWSEAILGSLPE